MKWRLRRRETRGRLEWICGEQISWALEADLDLELSVEIMEVMRYEVKKEGVALERGQLQG